MAHIDPRLQPLFGLMNEAGYDWIVSEILDGLRQGRPRLASQSELESVRVKIGQRDETPEEFTAEPEFYESIVGDNQIDFVVDLVRGRFESIAGMLNEASKNLHSISAHSDSPAPEPRIAFQVEGEIRYIDSPAITELSDHIDRLSGSISAWAASVRTTTGDAQ
jgi:hypothetical protein